MSTIKTIGNFADVRQVLDEALAHGGGTYRLPTRGKAIKWRQRAYTFRSRLREMEAARDVLNTGVYTTPYDGLTLRIDFELDPTLVHIEIIKATGVFTPADGSSPVQLEKRNASKEKNKFDEAAREFSAGLAAPAIDIDPEAADGDGKE